ncbi:MAG: transcriptional repressor LexA [Wenzhouxiangella sp.]|jgi:repressor LexA|nr:transcriptional repressor LexA [Wenzhouxiangella sp.]
MKLTARQQDILHFIHRQIAERGVPPTRAEIVKHFGFRSPNAAQCHLQALAERGAIRLMSGTARGIVPTKPGPETAQPASARRLPVIGRVTAGRPILAVENQDDFLSVDPAAFRPRPDYILKVEGDSMLGAGIHDGDLLVVHRTAEARSGQIVVARLGDEVTVKRLRRRGRGIYLAPENPDYPVLRPDPNEDFAIEGIGVGIIRQGLGG